MRNIDFFVIGAQKAGTTTLHVLLQQHPDIFLPAEKEAPFFAEPGLWPTYEAFLHDVFGRAPVDKMWGVVSPQYMRGGRGLTVADIASKIALLAPQAKLIALLRDPVERALSEWRMCMRRGVETRSFAVAVETQLAPQSLRRERLNPSATGSYVVQGEYGRILGDWLRAFPREQLLVCTSGDLASDQRSVARDVFEFLEIEPLVINEVDSLHVSGLRTKVPPEELNSLFDMLRTHAWHDVTPAQHRAFAFWFEMWNIIPDSPPDVATVTMERLREHFYEDAKMLDAIVHRTHGTSE